MEKNSLHDSKINTRFILMFLLFLVIVCGVFTIITSINYITKRNEWKTIETSIDTVISDKKNHLEIILIGKSSEGKDVVFSVNTDSSNFQRLAHFKSIPVIYDSSRPEEFVLEKASIDTPVVFLITFLISLLLLLYIKKNFDKVVLFLQKNVVVDN
jgi:hypothetical protein